MGGTVVMNESNMVKGKTFSVVDDGRTEDVLVDASFTAHGNLILSGTCG